MVQLTDEMLGQLDHEAGRRGCSRSAVVRDAIAEYLSSTVEHEQVRRYVEGYRGLPQGAVDEWGDLAKVLERATAETARRLDAEDAAAGLSW